MLEKLVMNETKLPVVWECGFHVHKVRSVGHVETDFKFRRLVAVGNDASGKDFDLWDQDFSRLHDSFFIGRL